jgi:hypothetical protein
MRQRKKTLAFFQILSVEAACGLVPCTNQKFRFWPIRKCFFRPNSAENGTRMIAQNNTSKKEATSARLILENMWTILK